MDLVRRHLVAQSVNARGLRLLTDGPRPIHLFELPGDEAESAWGRLHASAADVGLYPIILGDTDKLDQFQDNFGLADAPSDETIKYSGTLQAARWFDQRQEMNPELYEVDPADWPDDVEPQTTLYSLRDARSGQPHSKVSIALTPSATSWESPAYLHFGGWNDCPEAAAHVAVWKYWHQTYGADIAAITSDVIEAHIKRPPATRDAAMALAKEQFTYCYDIVGQGTQSIETLAAGLLDAPVWFFWWD